MATPTALAKRTSDAQQRMAETGPRLAARLGIDYPAVVKSKDPHMQRAREMEAFADFMDAVAASMPEPVDVDALKERHFAEFAESFNENPVVLDLEAAYAAYDSDERVNGPDDFEAFRDAVNGAFNIPEGTVEASLDGERIDRAAPAETADAEANAETDADSTGTPEPDAKASTAPDASGSPTRRRSARKDR